MFFPFLFVIPFTLTAAIMLSAKAVKILRAMSEPCEPWCLLWGV
jgi:hypothetical protein